MRYSELKLSEGAAIVLILSLVIGVVLAATHFFHVFSFPWIAWCVLGFGAVVTFGREMIVVRDPSDGPAPGPIESLLNSALVTLLLSTPALFVAVTVILTLLIASVDTYGLLATAASVCAVYALVIYALQREKDRTE
jgi:hypothetical protein